MGSAPDVGTSRFSIKKQFFLPGRVNQLLLKHRRWQGPRRLARTPRGGVPSASRGRSASQQRGSWPWDGRCAAGGPDPASTWGAGPGWRLCLGHPPPWESGREVAGKGGTQKRARGRERLARLGCAGFARGCRGTEALGELLPRDSAPRACSPLSLPASPPSSRSEGLSAGDVPTGTHASSYPAGRDPQPRTVPPAPLRGVSHLCAGSRLHVCSARSGCPPLPPLASPRPWGGLPPPPTGSQLQHPEAPEPTTGQTHAVRHGNSSGDADGHRHGPGTGAGGAACPPSPTQAGFPASPEWFEWEPECEEGAQKGLSWRRRVPAQ